MLDSLYNPNELIKDLPPYDAILVRGIVVAYAFHPERVKKNALKIREILLFMPETFWEGKGGGWSFVNLCMTKDDFHWGEHSDMEALVCLGIATGQASYCLPRDMWSALHGSVPYIVFHKPREIQSEDIG